MDLPGASREVPDSLSLWERVWVRALRSPFLFPPAAFACVLLLASTVGGQGVGASVLRRTSRAAVRVRTDGFVNTGWALTLRGNREWSLRPDYPNPLPHSRVGAPKCNNQSVGFDGLLSACPREVEGGWCGLTGAGSIRGCHKVRVPTPPLTNRSRRTRNSHLRAEPENDSSTIHLARGWRETQRYKQNGRTKPAVGTPRKSAYLPSSLNTSRAAETVSAMSCAVCAALTNPASYNAGAM